MPIKDTLIPPAHTTGGAIDVTLVDANGHALDMGCEFDAFNEKTKTDYFEDTEENVKIRDNRRLLYSCMISAGFTNLPSEWWHYDFGNKIWAYYKNEPAIYEGVFDKSELLLKNSY